MKCFTRGRRQVAHFVRVKVQNPKSMVKINRKCLVLINKSIVFAALFRLITLCNPFYLLCMHKETKVTDTTCIVVNKLEEAQTVNVNSQIGLPTQVDARNLKTCKIRLVLSTIFLLNENGSDDRTKTSSTPSASLVTDPFLSKTFE